MLSCKSGIVECDGTICEQSADLAVLVYHIWNEMKKMTNESFAEEWIMKVFKQLKNIDELMEG